MIKSENILHHIWQYQLFDKKHLSTSKGQKLVVIQKGFKNSNSGPDFDECRLIIDEIEWAGKVEIHIRSSDWLRHKHQHDQAYENVILHVVWEDDLDIFRSDKTLIPCLELKSIVHDNALKNYDFLMQNTAKIPCESLFSEQSDISKISMLEKALASRLERKSKEVLELYTRLNNDFEEVAYHFLMKNFGFKLNSEPFLRLAQNLPSKILAKHRGNIFQTEALLFGQAGFLDHPTHEYSKKLAVEYDFLGKKYELKEKKLERSEWKFMRTRPQNFPTVRMAQIAAILNHTSGLFSLFIDNQDLSIIIRHLDAGASEYWQKHYDWDKPSTMNNHLGKESVNILLINTVAPLLASYYYITDDYSYFERALDVLEKIKSEKNFITRIWDSLHLKSKTAFDSQAMIEQYNEFCLKKRCLECPVGVEIINPKEKMA